MAKSILQSDKECYLCRKRYNLRTTRGLEEHHILFGRGRRELSERYGLKVWLCHNHHNEPPLGVHFDPAARRELEQAAQFAFDDLHGPGSFAKVFGEEIWFFAIQKNCIRRIPMPQIVNKKSVLEMAMGAIAEITDYEVERVVANIMDPNTAATAKRKITITLTFAPDDYRQQIGMDAQAKTTLAPIQPVRTSLCITKARDGSLLLAEMTPQVPGQVDMDGDETPMPAMARVGRAGY